MNPGKARHVVDLMRIPSGQDSRGQPNRTPVVLASAIPCSIKPLAGRELENARQLMATATMQVEMWNDPTWELTTKDWIRFGQRKLNIGYVGTPDEVGLELKILCSEEV